MGHTFEELYSEAKEINNKIESQIDDVKDDLESDDLEKLASSLESYLLDEIDYYDEAMEKAASASKEDIIKIASFCQKAIEKGHSEEEILATLEKTAFAGIVPIVGKAFKNVLGAPLKGAKTLAFGSKASREAARAAASQKKAITEAAGKVAKGRKQKYIQAISSRGSKPTGAGIKSIESKALRQVKADRAKNVRSSVLSGKKTLTKNIPTRTSVGGTKTRFIKPTIVAGTGAAVGAGVHKAISDKPKQQQMVTYGY